MCTMTVIMRRVAMTVVIMVVGFVSVHVRVRVVRVVMDMKVLGRRIQDIFVRVPLPLRVAGL